MTNKQLLLLNLSVAVFAIVIYLIFFKTINQENTIEDYKTYSTEEQKEFNLSKTSNEVIYDVLDYDSYLDFCKSYGFDDVYTNENSYYMIVCIKAFSMGIEHHDYKIYNKENIIELHDHYTWGAAGDKYGLFLCIPCNEDSVLEYVNEFEYRDVN